MTPKVYFSMNLTITKKAVNTNQHRNETQSVILLLQHLSMKPDKGKSIQLFWIKEEKLFAQHPKLSCISWNDMKFGFSFFVYNSQFNIKFIIPFILNLSGSSSKISTERYWLKNTNYDLSLCGLFDLISIASVNKKCNY